MFWIRIKNKFLNIYNLRKPIIDVYTLKSFTNNINRDDNVNYFFKSSFSYYLSDYLHR